MAETVLPTYGDFLFPTLEVVAQHQGSARKDEIDRAVVDHMGITAEQLDVLYPPGAKAKGSKVIHRIAFARSSLKLAGALDNSERGVWTITAQGRDLLEGGDAAVRQADNDMRRRLKDARGQRDSVPPADTEDDDSEALTPAVVDDDGDWKKELLSVVESLPPEKFERVCARLLREAGCTEVKVLGRTGDEGLDGVGILQVSLLSFPVYFQAKRYRASQSIGPDKVRELRGALAGRGDKGILITTSYFTAGARDEANRAGAPIDLIDGDQLCDLLLTFGLGVEHRPAVVTGFFDDV